MTPAGIDDGVRPGTTTEEARRIPKLDREVRELRRANETLMTTSAFSPRRNSIADSRNRVLHRRPRRPLRVEPTCRVLAEHRPKIVPKI